MLAAGIQVTALFSPEHGISGRQDDEPDSERRGYGHRYSGLQPLFGRTAPSNCGNAERRRHAGFRYSGCWRAILHVFLHACAMRWRKRRSGISDLWCWTGRIRSRERMWRVRCSTPQLESFVGCFPMPVRHGLTFGELARMMNGELKLRLPLRVVEMRGWHRGDWFDSTNLTWVDPSPNMRSLNAAMLYPGVAMLEASKNYSVGRGTDAPFEQIGADWIHGAELAKIPEHAIHSRAFGFIRHGSGRMSSNFAGTTVEGVRLVVTDRDALDRRDSGWKSACASETLSGADRFRGKPIPDRQSGGG